MPQYILSDGQMIDLVLLAKGFERIALYDNIGRVQNQIECLSTSISPDFLKEKFPALRNIGNTELATAVNFARVEGRFEIKSLDIQRALENNDAARIEEIFTEAACAITGEKVVIYGAKVCNSIAELARMRDAIDTWRRKLHGA